MVILILLAALGLAGLVATIIEYRRDGFHRVPTDWTRVAEHDAEPISSYR